MISGRGGGASAGRRGSASAAGRIRPPGKIGMLTSSQGRKGKSEYDTTWQMLKTAIIAIHKHDSCSLSYEQLYRATYRIVLMKQGESLHEDVKALESDFFDSHIVPRLRDICTTNLLEIVCRRTASPHTRRETGEAFLTELLKAWNNHNLAMNMVADVMMYLDKQYLEERKQPSIFTTTIGLFRDRILRSTYNDLDTVQYIVNCIVLDQVEMERNGEPTIKTSLIKGTVSMLDALYETDNEHDSQKLYFSVFEEDFLEATREYYKAECQRLLVEADVGNWLSAVIKRLEEEAERCTSSLHLESCPKVLEIVDKVLFAAHLDEFLVLPTGLKWMIDNSKLENLAHLYTTNKRVDRSLKTIQRILQNHVLESGLETHRVIMQTDFAVPQSSANAQGEGEEGEGGKPKPLSASAQVTAAAIKWVDDILVLKDKFDAVWTGPFRSDTILETALTKTYTDVINGFDRASEYVSLYIDDLLRRGIRSRSEAEVSSTIAKSITLIRYLTEKDMFERYYQKHLARRLLNGKSESQDVEMEMISRMKTEFGTQFTSKFEGMFKDMRTSEDITRGYRQYARSVEEADGAGRIDLTVQILTTNNWPHEIMGRAAAGSAPIAAPSSSGAATSATAEGGPPTCNYPPEIERLHQSLKNFYLKDRSGRKLTWVSVLGSADIRCVFPAIPGKTGALARERRYEVNVSTYPMVVLMLFNDDATAASNETAAADKWLSLEEIQAMSGIPETDLARALQSLTIPPKSRILVKDPPAKVIHAGDRFAFNKSFVSKTVKIKVPTVAATSKVEAPDEHKATKEKADSARNIVIDAAIVRIMKQRRTLAHTQLITEVISQLIGRFKPEPAMIKRRIEDLITRDFLDRIEDSSPPTYQYVT